MTRVTVLDSESDGFAYECTKIHVMSWTHDGKTYESTNDYSRMVEVLSSGGLLIAHNSILHDMVVFNRILGFPMNYGNWADTLALSWYFFSDRQKHGLASWGEDLGIEKPKIENWDNLGYSEYAHRCEEDCKINWLLWEKIRNRMEEIY